MKGGLHSWGIWSYKLQLLQPLAVLGEGQRIRQGFVIGQKNTDSDQWNFAEVAPLPSFHQISHQETYQQLLQYFQKGLQPTHPLPQFGIHCLNSTYSNSGFVKCNWLWDGTVPAQATTLKIKVGRQHWKDEIHLLEQLLQYNPQISKLRLDANQQWSLEDLKIFWAHVQHLPVEYFEEPLQNPKDMIKCPEIPLALDESIGDLEKWLHLENIVGLVLKPTLHSNWKTILQSHPNTVLSSTFESDLGLWYLGQIALEHRTSNTSHGLNTLAWFSQRMLLNPIVFNAQGIDIQDAPILNWEYLNLETGQ